MANTPRNIGLGLARGITADVLGMPVDTLNMLREGLLSPAAGGNPSARVLGGLLGPVQQTGSGDWFAQQMGLPQGEGLAYEAARMVSPSPSDVMGLLRRAPIQEIMTYHGTPHRFEPTPDNPLGEFRASQIGTGEGAQAYGHGIYVAEDKGVAQSYAKNLSNRDIKNQNRLNAHANAQRLAGLAGDPEYAADDIRRVLETDPEHSQKSLLLETLRMLETGEYKNPLDNAGSLYTADLPDEMVDRMLDWDKPLSEQPEAVKQALMKDSWLRSWYERGKIDNLYQDGGAFYRAVTSKKAQDAPINMSVQAAENAAQAPASQYLRSLGIPGIKYLDAGSRGDKAKPTRNFVVFPGEEKKVKILKRE